MGMYDMCKNPEHINTDVSYTWEDIVKWIGEACKSDGTKKKKIFR